MPRHATREQGKPNRNRGLSKKSIRIIKVLSAYFTGLAALITIVILTTSPKNTPGPQVANDISEPATEIQNTTSKTISPILAKVATIPKLQHQSETQAKPDLELVEITDQERKRREQTPFTTTTGNNPQKSHTRTAIPKKDGQIAEKWDAKLHTSPSVVRATEVKTGDSLAKIFNKFEIHPSELHSFMQTDPMSKAIANLKPGQRLEFALDNQNNLLGFKLNKDALTTTWVTKTPELGFNISIQQKPIETRSNQAFGLIKNSLFLTGQDIGLSEKVIMELANLFGWDIDFALDIRTNDSFTLIYEEQFADGKKYSDGDIVAAKFMNAGREYTAFRYETSRGIDYFDVEGYSIRKAFLRSPVDFARISSHFNLKRRHPILHTIRAHKGVDYAAARGTPVKATGDGKVIFSGKKGGYGKTIILKHGERYTTLYAHLKGMAKGMRNGKRVKQGQIIGYVGSSGLATGPHLHYEFRENGVHVNPVTVPLPKAEPINTKYKDNFIAHAEKLEHKLNLIKSQALPVAMVQAE